MPPPRERDAPRALNIVAVNGSRLEAANLSTLRDILLDERYANKPVAVISVAGAMREGKSYLMNGCVNKLEVDGDWFTVDTPMNHFQFKGGSISCTSGIDIWSKPYIVERNGKEIVVFFMDTQGVFAQDDLTSVQSNIFALSILLSSIQIFNKMRLINGNDLSYLQLFTHMAKAGQTEDSKMFQGHLFIYFDEENDITHDDGEKYKWVRIFKETSNPEACSLQKDILASFQEIACCLFPAPGRKFRAKDSQPKEYFGDEEFEMFREAMTKFVDDVMDTLEPKQLNGLNITCKELFAMFEKLIVYFNSDEAPEAKTILQAMAEIHISSYLSRAKEEYNRLMDVPGAKDPESFLENVNKASDSALRLFVQCKAMGSGQFWEQSLRHIVEYTEGQFDIFSNDVQQSIDAAAREEAATYTRDQLDNCDLRSIGEFSDLREFIMRKVEAKEVAVAALEREDLIAIQIANATEELRAKMEEQQVLQEQEMNTLISRLEVLEREKKRKSQSQRMPKVCQKKARR